MPPPPRSALDLLSADLVERLSKEETRPPETPSTHLVGGLAKAGVALEKLLREVVRVAAEAERCDPSAILAPLGGRKVSLTRAPLGPMAHGLREFYRSRRSQDVPASVRLLVLDLQRRPSVVLTFIDRRNDIVKEGGDPERARDAAAKLRTFMVEFRRTAGWNSHHG